MALVAGTVVLLLSFVEAFPAGAIVLPLPLLIFTGIECDFVDCPAAGAFSGRGEKGSATLDPAARFGVDFVRALRRGA